MRRNLHTSRPKLLGLLYLNSIILLLFLSGCARKKQMLLEQVNYSVFSFSNKGESNLLNHLPDFSFAGYEKNAEPIPLVPVKETVTPELGDDGQRIQQAIDRVSQLPLVNGFRGAVLLKAGIYEVEKTLWIRTDGVVLRGEGQGSLGTTIMATSKLSWDQQVSLITLQGGTAMQETGMARSDISADIAVGATDIPVVNATAFHVGDTVAIRKMVNQDWVSFLGMDEYGWKPSIYQIYHRRTITGIRGDTLLINIPIVDAIYQQYGGGYVTAITLPGRISHCGVENMQLQSVYASDQDEMHAFSAVTLSGATNSWVRNVTAKYFVFGCVNITNRSDFNTIQDCAMLDPKAQSLGSRMYSFYINVNGGMGNLIQRCYSRNARHDFGVSAYVTGPNAFVDCSGANSKDPTGPHQRWSTGTLFDNIQGEKMFAHNARDNGTGHGWEGAQTLFWNCKAHYLNVSSPPGAINWAIGCRSDGSEGDGYWLSQGRPVEPRSLFFGQLKDRLGISAVSQVAISSQLNSTGIWGKIDEWAGSAKPLKEFQ